MMEIMDFMWQKHPLLVLQLGDCPNLEMVVLTKQMLWDNIETKLGWRLQQNRITKVCRILDACNVQKAWGSYDAMKEKFRRLTRKDFLERGDVIGVTRKLYDHYAIYIGNGEVIHYAAKGKDFGSHISIHKASLDDFLKGEKNYFVLHFFENGKRSPIKIQSATVFGFSDNVILNEIKFVANRNYHLYSAEETILRAHKKIGESAYNLVTNNCEHFAIYCKTNVSESYQVKSAVKRLIGIKKI